MSELKICLECGEKFSPRQHEGPVQFSKRIYCSQKCVLTYLARRRFRKKHPEEKDISE